MMISWTRSSSPDNSDDQVSLPRTLSGPDWVPCVTDASGVLSEAGRQVFQYRADSPGQGSARPRRTGWRPKLWHVLLGTFVTSLAMLSVMVSALWRCRLQGAIQRLDEQHGAHLSLLSKECEESVEHLVSQMHRQVGLLGNGGLKAFAAEPLSSLADDIDSEDLDLQVQRMWWQFRRRGTLAGIFFADSFGMYVEYERSCDRPGDEACRSGTLRYRPPDSGATAPPCPRMCPAAGGLTPGYLHVYSRNASTGRPINLTEKHPHDNAAQPWWVATGGDAVLIGDQNRAGTAILRVFRSVSEGTSVKAVVGADVALDRFTAVLQGMPERHGARIFVMDRAGRMVASSGGMDQVLRYDSGGVRRQRLWYEAGDAVVAAAVRDILRRFGGLLGAGARGPPLVEKGAGVMYLHSVVGPAALEWIIVAAEPIAGHGGQASHATPEQRRQIAGAQAALLARLDASVNQAVSLSLAILAAGALVMAFVAQAVTRPLKRMSSEMRAVARLDPGSMEAGLRAGALSCGIIQEVADMRDSFGTMANGLQSFAKYMDYHLVQILMQSGQQARLGVAKAEVTVFFSDLAGFTGMAEALDPQDLMGILQTYLEEMSNIIMLSGGIVGEFIGDAIMAWWNAPIELGENHTVLAVGAALAQQRRLEHLREQWCQRGLPEVHARMGLARGEVLAGNIGSTARMKYGLVGDTVNLASRLEGLCKKYKVSILVDEDVRNAPGVSGEFHLRAVDLVTVKGRQGATELFQLIARTSETNDLDTLSDFTQDFAAIQAMYRSMDFGAAVAALHLYRSQWPSDTPARLLQERCAALMASPPARGWSPVERLTEK